MPPQPGLSEENAQQSKQASSLKPVLVLSKKMGQTPLECMEEFRRVNPQYASVPMTYAGRLDPLATGVLIALTGEECKKKDQYTQHDKEYEVTLLFGIGTDTHDVLGMPNFTPQTATVSYERVAQVLSGFVGTFTQLYPAYSSKTVHGTPLFELARAAHASGGSIAHDLPSHQVSIHSIDIVDTSLGMLTAPDVLALVREMISSVHGDFRQDECMRAWSDGLAHAAARGGSFATVRIRVHCSHGTYMRQLAADVGKVLGMGALALRIHRTRVGEYNSA